jgi:hypothetical protein
VAKETPLGGAITLRFGNYLSEGTNKIASTANIVVFLSFFKFSR